MNAPLPDIYWPEGTSFAERGLAKYIAAWETLSGKLLSMVPHRSTMEVGCAHQSPMHKGVLFLGRGSFRVPREGSVNAPLPPHVEVEQGAACRGAGAFVSAATLVG